MTDAEFEDGYEAEAWDADAWDLDAEATEFDDHADDDLDAADDLDDDADDDLDDDADDDLDDDADDDLDDDADDDDDDDDDDNDDFDDEANDDLDDDFDDDAGENEFRDIGGWQLGTSCKGIRLIRIRDDKAGKTPFSDSDFSNLCAATTTARGFARNAKAEIDRIWKNKRAKNKRKAWKDNVFLKRWFGSKRLSRRQIRVTRRRIRLIASLLQTGIKIIVIPPGAVGSDHCSNTRAFSSWLTPIKICPQFFDGDDEQRAMTIIHELVHAIGHPHQTISHDGELKIAKTQHTPEQRWLLAHMASQRPMRARRNPANFAVLFRDMFMGTKSSTKEPK